MIDVNEIRKDFPMLNNNIENQGHKLVYFDNAATTFKPYVLCQTLNDYYMNYTANAHRGDYDISLKVDEMYETTRNKVKDFILYCNTVLKDFSFSPCYFVDFIFDVNNFN